MNNIQKCDAKSTKCDTCINGWVRISENGYCAKCTLSQKKAVNCLTGVKSYYIEKPSIKGGANG